MKHKMIIQRLNSARINGGILTEYPAASFAGVSFDGTPLILAKGVHVKHPTTDDVANGRLSPDDYEIVGYVSESQVVSAGTPRIEGSVEIANDELSAGITAGKYALSSGFRAHTSPTDTGQRIDGDIQPNHVLIFPVANAQPNDGMAAFMNLRDSDDVENLLGNVLSSETTKIKCKTDTMAESTTTPTTSTTTTTTAMIENAVIENVAALKADIAKRDNEITNLNAALTESKTEIGNLKTVIANRDAKIAELSAIIEQGEKDKKWAEIVNILPDALKDAREKFEADPTGFAIELATIKSRQAAAPAAEGTTIANTSAVTGGIRKVGGYKIYPIANKKPEGD